MIGLTRTGAHSPPPNPLQACARAEAQARQLGGQLEEERVQRQRLESLVRQLHSEADGAVGEASLAAALAPHPCAF